MTKILLLCVLSFTSGICWAAFEGADVPIAVKVLRCDGNPRILVQFEDSSKNIWHPANAGDASKEFLSIALAAKASSSGLYYYGLGNPSDVTTYCIGIPARQVYLFGLQ